MSIARLVVLLVLGLFLGLLSQSLVQWLLG
jgi:hypothetical protein